MISEGIRFHTDPAQTAQALNGYLETDGERATQLVSRIGGGSQSEAHSKKKISEIKAAWKIHKDSDRALSDLIKVYVQRAHDVDTAQKLRELLDQPTISLANNRFTEIQDDLQREWAKLILSNSILPGDFRSSHGRPDEIGSELCLPQDPNRIREWLNNPDSNKESYLSTVGADKEFAKQLQALGLL